MTNYAKNIRLRKTKALRKVQYMQPFFKAKNFSKKLK